MKSYCPINHFRLVDIRVFANNEKVYEGKVEDVPEQIGKWKYSKAEGMNPICLYVENEEIKK